ncbi:hypothetical protein [Deinococcus koreensis]|uniref:Uncharacterized protein n=1 Tax=Deinococcus koreensis TaxID=2054903 RepID=A0A2K3UWG6_9DEIO|nr:hypothetical protein [Deinococcus koreensis]PNY80875.1 hypothetical protein CVO96_05385 [Deinococcus koreensis]
MNARLRALTLAALLPLALAPAAQATTAPPLTLEQQARKADVIVRATLGAVTNVTEGGVSYQVYPLTITETLVGDAASLPQSGGRPALFFLQGLADLPALTTGQDVIALLYARRLDSPLVGFNQGLYPVTNGAVKAKTAAGADITDPAKLRDAIRAAREAR